MQPAVMIRCDPMHLWFVSIIDPPMLLLIGVVVFIYVATRTLLDAIESPADTPGWAGLIGAVPTALVAVIAAWRGRPEIALGVLLATSVGLLTLVLGILTLIGAPRDEARLRRLWALVLPCALILLLIGFRGQLDRFHGFILLVQAVPIFLLWLEPSSDSSVSRICRVDSQRRRGRWVIVLLGLGVAWVGALAAVQATIDYSAWLRLPSGALVATLMIAPALVLPIIGVTGPLAQGARYTSAVTMLVAIVLVNLCVAIPLVIGVWEVRNMVIDPAAHRIDAAMTTTTEHVDHRPTSKPVLVFPMSTWRVDTVLLVIVGLLLLPVAMGLWPLGRVEGVALILGYVAYVGITGFMARGG